MDTGTKDLAEALLEDSALANRIFPIVLGEPALLVVHCWQSDEECTQGIPSEELHMGRASQEEDAGRTAALRIELAGIKEINKNKVK